MSYKLNQKDEFVDITRDFSVLYKDETLLGHKFRHVSEGIYVADPGFIVDDEELKVFLSEYRDIVFCVNSTENDNKEIVFAYSVKSENNTSIYLKLSFLNEENDERFKGYLNNRSLEGYIYEADSCNDDKTEDLITPVMKPHFLYGENAFSDNMVITLEGEIGYMVEDGIYYFPETCLVNRPKISIFGEYNGNIAVVGNRDIYTNSLTVSVKYAAVKKEYFEKLKKLMMKSCSDSKTIYCELGEDKTIKYHSYEKKVDKKITDLPIHPNAKEIVEGIGLTDITLRICRPFLYDSGFMQYKAAYILDDELVLLLDIDNKLMMERHKLDYLSGLYVKIIKNLNCGIEYPVIHEVINSGEEKLKEILIDDAYENYLYELYQDKIINMINQIDDSYFDFNCGVMAYARKSISRMKKVYEYLEKNPDITTSDVLEFISSQPDFFEN